MPDTVQSMTGFARVEGSRDDHTWVWEAKSVNARGLDVRSRVPAGFDRFDPRIREAVRGALTRGTVSVALTVSRDGGGRRYRLDTDLLAAIAEAEPALRSAFPSAEPLSIDGLIAVRGLFESEDGGLAADTPDLDDDLVAGLHDLVAALAEERRTEGGKLDAILSDQIAAMRTLVDEARASDAAHPAAIKTRLKAQIDGLLAGDAGVPEDRLAQEAAIMATKADIREELDRLDAHVTQAAALLSGGGPIGRKLDFLAQEFNREANTLCAKAGDLELGRIGLALKSVIDQFKEQAQNVE